MEPRKRFRVIEGGGEATAADAGPLAVRHDVDPRAVRWIFALTEQLSLADAGVHEAVDTIVGSHPGYGTTFHYLWWFTRRIDEVYLEVGWERCLGGNEVLGEVLALPEAERLRRVREDPLCSEPELLWLLVDATEVNLLLSRTTAEHFVDLLEAILETARFREKWGEHPLKAWVVAHRANSARSRGDLAEAGKLFALAERLAEEGGDPWIRGRVRALHSNLLDARGDHVGARRMQGRAARFFKAAKDPLQRCRCAGERAREWISIGVDSCVLYERVIDILRPHGDELAVSLVSTFRSNRLLGLIFLKDRLTGRSLAEIEAEFRILPEPRSDLQRYHHKQLQGLIYGLAGDSISARQLLGDSSRWYQDHEYPSQSAVTLLQLGWVSLKEDPQAACTAVIQASEVFRRIGFSNNYVQGKVAEAVREAETMGLKAETVRHAILAAACPNVRATGSE